MKGSMLAPMALVISTGPVGGKFKLRFRDVPRVETLSIRDR